MITWFIVQYKSYGTVYKKPQSIKTYPVSNLQ